MLVFQGWISPHLKCEDRSSGPERTGALMLTSGHAKKSKRQKEQGHISKKTGQCQDDLSVLGNLSHWSQSAAMEKNKISPFIVRVPFLPQGTPNLGEFLSFVIHLHI